VRILILNWRDIRSRRAGGAEVLTHEIARRLATRDQVTWFTSRQDGLPAREEIDGVQIVRRGSELTTRLAAPAFARSARWDLIIEEINTLPYLSHLWAASSTLLFIPQLARDVWWYEAPRTVAPVGYAVERLYLARYRAQNVITISHSTCEDLRALGFTAPIHVIPMAVSTPALGALPIKEPAGRLVSVGRLVPSKRFDHVIRAFAKIRAQVPAATLTVIGDGPQRQELLQLAGACGLRNAIEFTGRVPETEKGELLQAADVLVAASVREGWGLTTTEAARLGTPAVVYDVPGFRDSVIHERTGLLTAPNPHSLATAVIRVLRDSALYQSLRERGWRAWCDLSWDRTAAAFERALPRADS
jgi:glycosyltransferase involved in cell wall biosynthesis